MAIENTGEVAFQGGPAGLDGQSTYQAWLALGNTGSLADFMTAQRGATGPANALAIGTVSTGAPGSSASATITGTSPNQTLSLSVPQGATGANSWQTPPVAWSQGAAYTAQAPASSVVYGGETYVCATSHTSGSTFDATKWVKVAQKGADGSPSAGAVLYTVDQGLDVASRLQSKKNIGVLGSGVPQLTVSTVLAVADLNKIYTHYSSSNAAMTHTLPPVSTAIAGDRIGMIAPGLGAGTLYVRPAGSDTLATNGTAYGYANPLFVPQGAAVTFVCDGYNWYSEGYHTPMRSALNAHVAQSFGDTEKQQLLANADLAIPHCQGRLTYDANFQIALRVAVGNKIFINGNYRTIPNGGVTLSNSGLSASTAYYVYAYWTGSAVALIANTSGPAFDPLYGHKVFGAGSSDAANRIYTYVGMVYVGSDGKFADSPAFRGVVTAYNKRLRSVAGTTANLGSTTSTSQVELTASARVYVLIEAGTSLLASVFGWGGTSNSQPGYGMFVAASLDGDNAAPAGLASKAAYGDGTLASGYAWDPPEGLHYLTVKASVPSGGTGAFNGAVSGMVWM